MRANRNSGAAMGPLAGAILTSRALRAIPMPMAKSLKLVIFDVDGTLIDSQRIICAAMQKAFGAHALKCPPQEKLLSIVGLSLPDAFARLGEGEAGFPVATLIESYKDAFFGFREAGLHLEPVFPGAREALEALSRRPDILLGIATGKSQRGARAVLERIGMLDRFHTIKTADDAPSKPHPGMVIDAMREAGTDARDTVVVGDSIYDMEMARAAGAKAVGVSWGYHTPDALTQTGAHIVISGFAELIPALDAIWSGVSADA